MNAWEFRGYAVFHNECRDSCDLRSGIHSQLAPVTDAFHNDPILHIGDSQGDRWLFWGDFKLRFSDLPHLCELSRPTAPSEG